FPGSAVTCAISLLSLALCPSSEVRFASVLRQLSTAYLDSLFLGCASYRSRVTPKDKLFKRHAARIRRPSAGFCGVWRRHIMRFMFTRGESCPGLPQLFRRRATLLQFVVSHVAIAVATGLK